MVHDGNGAVPAPRRETRGAACVFPVQAPKGVVITQSNILNYVENALSTVYHFLSPRDRMLQNFSTCFDAALEEIWLPFLSGATLVVSTTEIARDIAGPSNPQYKRVPEY